MTEPNPQPTPEDHGMVEEVHCDWVYVASSLMREVFRSLDEARVRRAQKVKILIYHGEVKKVFCKHIDGCYCSSPLKKGYGPVPCKMRGV